MHLTEAQALEAASSPHRFSTMVPPKTAGREKGEIQRQVDTAIANGKNELVRLSEERAYSTVPLRDSKNPNKMNPNSSTHSIPNGKTFYFFGPKFDHSSYSKNLCANIVKFKLFLKNFY